MTEESLSATTVPPRRASARDDFSAATKRLLAERVGYLCSNPACRAMTIGAGLGTVKSVTTGIGAHIAAAASGPGAARYDPAQTSEERSHYDNGIWLCANHAQQIDRDPAHFTVELLRKWKTEAEHFAAKLVTSGRGLRDVDVPESLESVRERALAAAAAHLASFKRLNWPEHPIALSLVSEAGLGDRKSFGVESLAGAVSRLREIKLIAPPGLGKTTTMVQLGDALLEEGSIPLLVPLQDWANQPLGLLDWVAATKAFADIGLEALGRLLNEGHVVFLLDGLNEVPKEPRQRLISQIAGLRRDYQLLMLVISTRRQASDAEIGNAVVEVQELTDVQQEEIARAVNGDAGLGMLDRAWRTPGLRDLVAVPMYLQALLKLVPTGELPATKDEVVAALIRNHEENWLRRESIEAFFEGQHDAYLRDLAVFATTQGAVTVSQVEANRSVAGTSRSLVADGQILQPPEPHQAIETLVGIHALKRDADAHVSFQHHQLQEWYASLYVEAALLAHSGRQLLLSDDICVDIINERPWEEALVFACERLSRRNGAGITAAAKVILVSLGIDPILSASLINRCSEATWATVGDEIIAFAASWHTVGKPDQAFAFMVATGRPEFADRIWTLVANRDEQRQAEALYKAGRFTPLALAAPLAAQLAALPEGTRAALLSQFVDAGGYAGIEGAVAWATRDGSDTVRFDVIQSLLFRRADRQATNLLTDASEDVWRRLGQKGYADEFSDEAVAARLQSHYDSWVAQEDDPNAKLSRLLREPERLDEAQFLTILADPALDMRKEGVGWSLSRLAEQSPAVLAKGLLQRIIAGLNLPFSVETVLPYVDTEDDGPIADIALNGADEQAKAAASLVGPATVRQMVDTWLPLDALMVPGGAMSKPDVDHTYFKRDLLGKVRPAVLLTVMLQFVDETNVETIASLCELIALHGRDREASIEGTGEVLRAAMLTLLTGWASILMESNKTKRDHLSELAGAMGRMPDVILLPSVMQMLDEDLKRWQASRTAHFATRAGGHTPTDVITSYTNVYGDLLYQIGGDAVCDYLTNKLSNELFGADAANVLARMGWPKDRTKNPAFRHWLDYDRAKVTRARRDADPGLTVPEAEAIFMQVDTLLAVEGEKPGRAMALAGWGAMLPHGDRQAVFKRLLGLTVRSDATLDLLIRMFLGGEIPPHAVLLDGLRRFFDDHHYDKWKFQNEPWEIIRWLELFPHSDRPESLFDAIEVVKEQFKPNLERMDGLFVSLRHITGGRGPALLAELARREPSVLKGHDWYRAFLFYPPLPALGALIDLADDVGDQWASDNAGHNFSEELALLVAPSTVARTIVKKAFGEVKSHRFRYFLAEVMLQTGNAELFATAISEPVGQDCLSRSMHSLLRNIAYREDPLDQTGRTVRYVAVDVRGIRAILFSLATSDDRKTAHFGQRALRNLDELRRDYGGVDTEPRHPDIRLERDWPILPEV